MKQYVLGILYCSDTNEVALIQKERPAWQKGFFNFLGGKIEPDETPEQAVSREIYEEAGFESDPADWSKLGAFATGEYELFVFHLDVPEEEFKPVTMTDEMVVKFPIDDILKNDTIPVINNVRWMLNFLLEENADFRFIVVDVVGGEIV